MKYRYFKRPITNGSLPFYLYKVGRKRAWVWVFGKWKLCLKPYKGEPSNAQLIIESKSFKEIPEKEAFIELL